MGYDKSAGLDALDAYLDSIKGGVTFSARCDHPSHGYGIRTDGTIRSNEKAFAVPFLGTAVDLTFSPVNALAIWRKLDFLDDLGVSTQANIGADGTQERLMNDWEFIERVQAMMNLREAFVVAGLTKLAEETEAELDRIAPVSPTK